MNKISFCLICWLNYKGYYYQSYSKNNHMPKIAILFYYCGGQNKTNVMIRFLNIIKEGGLFGTATLNFYIKGHTNNYYNRACNRLKLLYRKQMSLLLRSDVKYWIPEIILKLFKCSMKTSLTWNYSWMISTTELILKPSASIISPSWKKSQHTLDIVKSSMERQSLNIIIRNAITTAVHRGR